MDEAKRKRNRKRSRGGNGGGKAESEVEVAPVASTSKLSSTSATVQGKSRTVGKGLADSRAQNGTKAEAAPAKGVAVIAATEKERGPSLSFYDKTNPHKPSALPSLTAAAPRKYTVSVALPGSIILNAQTPELQARLAGHIARACAIFNIDEIIVFDEGKQEEASANGREQLYKRRRFDDQDEQESYAQGDGQDPEQGKNPFDPNAFLARILQYVETPQYLRKTLFPMHRDLRLAGLLAPLDCPHHLRFEDESPFREGVCVEAPHWVQNKGVPAAQQCHVYTGLRDPVPCSAKASNVPIGARVTVRMPPPARPNQAGQLVSPRTPVEERGLYWGYSVRLCATLSDAIRQTPYAEPYDFVIGTSERGSSLTDLHMATVEARLRARDGLQPLDADNGVITPLPPFKHALIMFGGLSGLEVAVERDATIPLAADEANELFDAWINVVEGQGSRTIRTEEAMTIALARLRPLLDTLGQS